MAAIEGVLDSMQLFLGPQTAAFEQEFAAYCHAQSCVAVANGTDALHLALRAAQVGEGDEVITVAHTFFATVEAIRMVGARPVFVDIDPRSCTIDVEGIERHITNRTRAIMPVHLYGQMADMDPIMDIAARRKLIVIEDAAQAHGAEYRGRRAGSIGHLGCFSFYYSKNLGAYGEAGAVTTSDPDMVRRLRMYRDHGSERRYHHLELGFNARMDEMQAAVLRVKLRYLDSWNDLRRRHANRYNELLRDAGVGLPEVLADRLHAFYVYVIRSRHRDQIQQWLTQQGIGTAIHFPIPIHLQPASRDLGYVEGDLPATEQIAREVLSLPMYPELTDDQQRFTVEQIRAAICGSEPVISQRVLTGPSG